MKTDAPDLFKEVLPNISIKNLKWFKGLSDEQRKKVVPFLVQRYLSGVKNGDKITLLNDFVNPYVFSLYKHPTLLIFLLMAVSSGDKFFSYPKQKKDKKSLRLKVIMDWHQYSAMRAREVLCMFTDEDFVEFAEALGWEKNEIKSLKEELKESGQA